MQKAVQSNFRTFDLPATSASENAEGNAALLARIEAPLTTAAACLAGALLSSLVPWLWTTAAWTSGMRPEALAIVIVAAAIASAFATSMTTMAARWHPAGPLAVTAVLFVVSLSKLPLHAESLIDAPAAATSSLSLMQSMLALAGLPIAALTSALTLLHRTQGTPAARWATTSSIAMLVLYPLAIEPTYALATQAGLWMAGFVLAAVLTIAATARRSAQTSHKEIQTDENRAAPTVLHAAMPAAILPPLLTDVASHLAPMSLPGCTILAATMLAALLAKRARARQYQSSLFLSPMTLIWLALTLIAIALPATSTLRLLIAAAALIGAVVQHATASEVSRPRTVAIGIALGAFAGWLLTRVPLPWPPLSIALVAALVTGPQMRPERLDARSLRRLVAAGLLAVAVTLTISISVDIFGSSARIAAAMTTVPVALFIVHRVRFWSERNIVCLFAALAAMAIIPTSWKSIDSSVTAWSPLRITERIDGSERRVHSGISNIAKEPSSPNAALVRAIDSVRRAKQTEFNTDQGQTQPLLIGLTGTTTSSACLANSNDVIRVFEADPTVISIAANPRWLANFARCAPTARVIPGDPRHTLSQEPDEAFDILLVDASAFPAPPLHLLTADRLVQLLAKVSPNGLLALAIGHDRIDISRWLARQVSQVSGTQAAMIDRDLVLLTRSAVMADEIAAWPEANGLERLPPTTVPKYLDLVAAIAARRASAGR